MGIYIKGMEMPTEEEIGKCIIVRHDGEVWIVDFDNLIEGGYACCYPTNPMRAVPVPPHGRLVDLDALQKQIDIARNYGMIGKTAHYKLQKLIKEAPTIIPASEEGE